ncbi:hypothetical protein H6G33_05735 [Calothrix sp. FACHB-1219]|uniref:hypothetical protein n=1 Tax=unclassified Calothrix TaxID=2619626 RepID=UPI0016850BA3|nr:MULTISPECIES: hypothetical protein [unclassified Calothrix]MBD2205121.1 hypothetical protein [Calothrix sp. FACHB-168]MBD2216527.1 hypothetical protein [Calothrix sp. FACHB-1219]
MPTDYILFVHGVKVYDQKVFEGLCQLLVKGIQESITDKSRTIKPIFFFWGDLNLPAQQELVTRIEASSKWNEFWFRDFRTEQILEFVGDAALYLSRHVGTQVVQRFQQQAFSQLTNVQTSDRLHLITHSWGTVILFDILFARRWEDPILDESVRNSVKALRNILFGIDPNPQSGIPIASIHTLGSPLALFSLLNISGNVNGVSTHDLTPELSTLLANLHNLRQKPLAWCNFAHPGDPIAYPLEGLKPMLLASSKDYVDIQDVITDKGNIFNMPFRQRLLPLFWGGEAHGSYWKNPLVSQTISEVIRSTV